jgi:hypothetical protein
MMYIMVDVEATGPVPGLFSMTELGAVIVDREMNKTFYGRFSPLEDAGFIPEALAVTDRTMEELETWPDPQKTMWAFETWVNTHSRNSRPIFISDNNGFDWQYVNYYFWKFCNRNPFGHSSNNLANIYGGLNKKVRQNIRPLRKTAHTHHPVDDARGNVEALLRLVNEMGLEI